MQIIVNKFILECFEKNNIFNSVNGVSRLKEQESIFIPQTGFMEEYCSFNLGNIFCQMESFSYSNASLARFDVKIGRYCSIAFGLNFIHAKHPLDLLSTSSFAYDNSFVIFKRANEKFNQNAFKPLSYSDFIKAPEPTIIENDVYICTNACLKPGITLHTGCVVGQNALVTKDVPPYAVVGGIPARILKYRFDEKTIQRLLKLQWWKYNFSDFKNINLKLDINAYLDILQKRIEEKEIEIFKPKRIHFEELIQMSKTKTHTQLSKSLNNNQLGAVSRVKSSLSYRLGVAMIQNSKSFLGLIKMFWILLSITKEHKQKTKIYEMMIQINPSLKLTALENYSDYEEALKCKNHLSYKLGFACVKAFQSNNGGGGLGGKRY